MCANIDLLSVNIKEHLPDVLSLRQAVDAYIKSQRRHLSPETIRIYQQSLNHVLERFGDDIILDEIEQADMLQWRDGLFEKDLSVHTIRRIHGDAATFFNWLAGLGFLDKSPMSGVQKPKAPDLGPQAISLEDFQLMLAESRIYRGNHWNVAEATVTRNEAMLLVLASSGCRAGGLVTARISRLEFNDEGAQTEVLEKGRAGGKVRTIYLSETAAIAVLVWLDHRPKEAEDHDYIFCVLTGPTFGRPLRSNQVRKTLARIAKRAGVKGRFNPHSFRHACAREWLRNGADLQTVSQLLGHSDIRTTATFYARWSDTELRDSHNRIDWTE